MRKIVFLCIGLMISVVSVFGQKTLKVTTKDMNMVIFRCAGDNETVVEVQSNVPLTFESTMDKEIAFCENKEENGFFFYQLKFTVERKYDGRKLKIKSHGFETHIEPLDLKAKVPVGLLVIDLNSDVGVGCYFEHLNKGNRFFDNTQYADAKAEYYLALECSDVPDDNDLSRKIEDAGTAIDSKDAADSYYNEGKYIEAKQEYEKLRGLNPNDNYPAERIAICDTRISSLPREIRIKVVDPKGLAMSNVQIQAEVYKVDKNGNIVYKNNKPQTKKWGQVGATNQQGECTVTVKRINKILKCVKSKDNTTEYFAETKIPDTSDEVSVTLKERPSTGAYIEMGRNLIDALSK